MFSKTVIRFCSFFVLAVALGGCGLKLGDKSNDHERAKIKDIGCLSGLEKKVSAYIDGDLSVPAIKETMQCVRHALNEFNYIGRGESTAGFRPEELARFLNIKFLGESKISPEFLKELMNVKLLMVGGRPDFVLNAEFDRLVELTRIIEKEAIANAPFIKIYRFNQSVQRAVLLNPRILNEAKGQLKRTAYNMAEYLRSSQKSYKMENLRGLFFEVRRFLKWDDQHPKSSPVEDWVELLSVYKAFATGAEGSAVRPSEWTSLLGMFADCYNLYMDGFYRLKLDDVRRGDALEELIKFVDQILNLLLAAVNNQPKTVLHFHLLDRALDVASRMQFMPDGIRTEDSIKPAMRYLLTYVFRDPLVPFAKAKSTGLTSVNINEIRKEFYLWAEGQRYLSRLYEKVPPRQETMDLRFLSLTTPEASLPEPAHEIQFLMDHIKPFYRVGDDRVWVVPSTSGYKNYLTHHFEGLSRLNVMRGLGRLLIRGWAKNTSRVAQMSGITIEEANDFYTTVKNLGQDLKLVDPRKDNVGYRFFREGNMFTFSGDGINPHKAGTSDDLLTLTESIEQLSLIYSGMSIRTKIFSMAQKVCQGRDRQYDIFGDPKIPADCLKKFMVDTGYKYFNNLPGLKTYTQRLTRASRAKFFDDIWSVSQSECSDPQWVEFGEVVTFTTLMHYLEVVFIKYDHDQNEILDGAEVMRSFSRFSGFLDEAIATTHPGDHYSVSMQKGIFAYLVSKRKIPGNIMDLVKLKWWDFNYFDNDRHQFDKVEVEDISAPKMSVERSELMEVLGVLNANTKSEVTCEIRH